MYKPVLTVSLKQIYAYIYWTRGPYYPRVYAPYQQPQVIIIEESPFRF